MLDPINLAVKARFYEAFDKLVELGLIKNRGAFALKYEIDRRNFIQVRKLDTRRIDVRLLSIIVSDYNISPMWILTGQGKMFNSK